MRIERLVKGHTLEAIVDNDEIKRWDRLLDDPGYVTVAVGDSLGNPVHLTFSRDELAEMLMWVGP